MSLLQAVVPDVPEARARIVPARLARKIGPLFGVAWPEGPFGDRTWVSDYSRLTLTEIARGAPVAGRDGRAAAPHQGWTIAERAGLTADGATLPNEIANATLNRFGPDTKAAVVLTGVNVLLEPLLAAADAVGDLLVDDGGAPLPRPDRLAGWIAVVLEVFRSQPALFAAGIRARAIQRHLCTTWELPLSPATVGPLTRCEISAPTAGRAVSRPAELDLVDLGLRRLLDLGPSPDGAGPGSDELADSLLARLLEVGTLRDSSHLWLAERTPGALAVETFLPPTELIDRLVGRMLRGDAAGTGTTVLPSVPDPAAFAELPPTTRRALVIALLAVLRRAQFDPVVRERTRHGVLDRVDRLATALEAGLPASDPVGAVARCRIAVIRVQTRRHDRSARISDDVRELMRAADRCARLGASGVLDRGAAAEILAPAFIELNALRWTTAADDPDLPGPAELDGWLRRGWSRQLALLEVPAAALTGDAGAAPGQLAFHLHNHAAFLASHTDRPDDLRAAVTLLRDVVIPAREAFRDRTGTAEPLRHSLQIGSRATTALTVLAGPGDEAFGWAALGREWVHRALADPGTARLLAATPTEIACRFALQAAPALLTAAETGAGDGEDVRTAAELVVLARRWEETLGEPDRHARHAEITALVDRLERLGSPLAG